MLAGLVPGYCTKPGQGKAGAKPSGPARRRNIAARAPGYFAAIPGRMLTVSRPQIYATMGEVRDAIAETRPDDMNRLIRPERKLPMSGHPAFRPHPGYLAWHREHQFKRFRTFTQLPRLADLNRNQPHNVLPVSDISIKLTVRIIKPAWGEMENGKCQAVQRSAKCRNSQPRPRQRDGAEPIAPRSPGRRPGADPPRR